MAEAVAVPLVKAALVWGASKLLGHLVSAIKNGLSEDNVKTALIQAGKIAYGQHKITVANKEECIQLVSNTPAARTRAARVIKD